MSTPTCVSVCVSVSAADGEHISVHLVWAALVWLCELCLQHIWGFDGEVCICECLSLRVLLGAPFSECEPGPDRWIGGGLLLLGPDMLAPAGAEALQVGAEKRASS